MDLILVLLLVFLFIFGLLSTLLNFPTKKFTSLLQTFFVNNGTKETMMSPDIVSGKSGGDSGGSNSGQNRAELKRVFATFDKNKDGFITKQELSESLRNIGISTSEREVVEMVEKVDSNGDGLIDFDEFCTLFESMVSREEAEGSGGESGDIHGKNKNDHEEEAEDADLKEAFNVFDGDRDGLISVEELSLVLSSLGFKEGKKLEECKEMIKRVDVDGDGMVNFNEFKSMMKSGGRLVSVSRSNTPGPDLSCV